MIIASSNIGMESTRKYSSLRMDAYSFGMTEASKNNSSVLSLDENNKKSGNAASNETSFQDSMDNLMKRFEAMRTKSITNDRSEENAITRIKTECINYLIRLLFGGKIDDEYLKNKFSMPDSSNSNNSSVLNISTILDSYYEESESVSYETKGTVITADGKEIDFNLSFEMSRSFEEYYHEESLSEIVNYCDPLVINLDTNVASVSDQKFLFDIDCDGVKDNISMLNKNSGYLALDLNNDGIINDGSELFGTKSGNGFKDLSAYDSDKNGWIDEADEIWDKLLIYSMNEDGSSELFGLKDKNVGAIFLGNVSTDFSLNNNNNETNAAIRKTGIFLYENGNVGTIQHIDLVK